MVVVRRRSTGTPSPARRCGGCPPARPPSWLVTVAVVVATHNLAIGVVVGSSPPWSSSPGASPTSSTSPPSRTPTARHGRLLRHRRAVLRLQQRPRRPVRLRRRPGPGRSSTCPAPTSGTPPPSPPWTPSPPSTQPAARRSRSSASTPQRQDARQAQRRARQPLNRQGPGTSSPVFGAVRPGCAATPAAFTYRSAPSPWARSGRIFDPSSVLVSKIGRRLPSRGDTGWGRVHIR